MKCPPDGGVTATNNIPGGAAPGATPAGSTNSENAETTNYEISKTTTTTTKEPGEVKKLAVAVAVDGKWTPAKDGKGEPTYAPRTAEEIAQIKSLVAAAAAMVRQCTLRIGVLACGQAVAVVHRAGGELIVCHLNPELRGRAAGGTSGLTAR